MSAQRAPPSCARVPASSTRYAVLVRHDPAREVCGVSRCLILVGRLLLLRGKGAELPAPLRAGFSSTPPERPASAGRIRGERPRFRPRAAPVLTDAQIQFYLETLNSLMQSRARRSLGRLMTAK